MQAGTYLTPAAIGYLAGVGCPQVDVYAKPRVSLIVTGDELQPLGTDLHFGQVYESNSIQLNAALQQYDIELEAVIHVRDDAQQLKQAMEQALSTSDVLLLVGGAMAVMMVLAIFLRRPSPP